MKPKPNHLQDWLADPRMDAYLGRRAAFKLAIADAVMAGEPSVAEISRRFSASRQAGHVHACRFRELFTVNA